MKNFLYLLNDQCRKNNSRKMSTSSSIPNELTSLTTEMTTDLGIIRANELGKKSQWTQITCSLMANATVLSSGMGLGFSAITLETLQDINNPLKLNDEQASWFGENINQCFLKFIKLSTCNYVTASISTLVCPLGGILSAMILDRMGRKLTLMFINMLSIISWSLIYFCSSTNFDEMFWQLMLGRFFIGQSYRVCNFQFIKSNATLYLLRYNDRAEQFPGCR